MSTLKWKTWDFILPLKSWKYPEIVSEILENLSFCRTFLKSIGKHLPAHIHQFECRIVFC